MKILLRTLALTSISLIVGCSASAPVVPSSASPEWANNEAITRATNRVLILSAAYVDPNVDTVGINKVTERVMQRFSAELQPLLSAAKKTPIYVTDRTTRQIAGEKLALYAVQSDADAAVILSIETPQTNGQYSIHLKAQYFDLRHMLKDGAPSGVIPTNGFERSYYLRRPQGHTTLTYKDLADSFIANLKAAGRLP